MDFMRGNLDILRQKIIDELFVLSIFEVSDTYRTMEKFANLLPGQFKVLAYIENDYF